MEEDKLNDLVESVEFHKMGKQTTVCFVTLKNGYEMLGRAACVNPEEYNQTIGETLAYQDFLNQLNKLEAYASVTPCCSRI